MLDKKLIGTCDITVVCPIPPDKSRNIPFNIWNFIILKSEDLLVKSMFYI